MSNLLWLLVPVSLLALGTLRSLLAQVRRSVEGSLPERLAREPVPTASLSPALVTEVGRLRALGFEPAGNPFRLQLTGPVVAVPLVYPGERSFATAFEIGGRVFFDFISRLAAGKGGLTTSPNVGGGSTPATPGALRQIFPGGDPKTVWQRHREAIAHLERAGVVVDPVGPADFEGFFAESIRRQRANYLAGRRRFELTALWRTLRKTSPHLCSIADQADARAEIEKLARARPRAHAAARGGRPVASR